VENPDDLLTALRTGIILVNIFAGALGGILAFKTAAAAHVIIPAIAGSLVFTILLVLLRSTLARPLARAAPESILVHTLPLIRLLRLLFTPLIFIAARSSALAFRILRVNSPADQGMTEDELRLALAEGEKSGIVESEERTMVEGVFYLGDRPAGAFMTHRSEIQWLDSGAGAEEIRAMARDHGAQGCFPVADGTLDEIIGGAFLGDILQALPNGFSQGLTPLIKKVPFIPETMSALKAFEAFKRGETNYLFVMDEYGGFAGLLSVQDLVEEIVGQLSAGKADEDSILPQDDGTWLADGSASIDDIAAALGLSSLAESHQDYHTLAGFILSLAGEIPKTAASFSRNGFNFKIVDMDGNRIDKVMISRVQENE
jgi:putative hemolysin